MWTMIFLLVSLLLSISISAKKHEQEVDVVFIVDGSRYAHEMLFRQEILLIPQIVSQLSYNKFQIRIGLITYSDQATLQIGLGFVENNNVLLEKLWHIKHPRYGKASFCYALRLLRTKMYKGDSTRKRFVIAFTNSMWNLPKVTTKEVGLLKEMGVKILMVVIGNYVNKMAVMNIAGYTNIIYRPHITLNFIQKRYIYNFIVNNIYENSLPFPSTQSSVTSKSGTPRFRLNITSTISSNKIFVNQNKGTSAGSTKELSSKYISEPLTNSYKENSHSIVYKTSTSPVNKIFLRRNYTSSTNYETTTRIYQSSLNYTNKPLNNSTKITSPKFKYKTSMSLNDKTSLHYIQKTSTYPFKITSLKLNIKTTMNPTDKTSMKFNFRTSESSGHQYFTNNNYKTSTISSNAFNLKTNTKSSINYTNITSLQYNTNTFTHSENASSTRFLRINSIQNSSKKTYSNVNYKTSTGSTNLSTLNNIKESSVNPTNITSLKYNSNTFTSPENTPSSTSIYTNLTQNLIFSNMESRVSKDIKKDLLTHPSSVKISSFKEFTTSAAINIVNTLLHKTDCDLPEQLVFVIDASSSISVKDFGQLLETCSKIMNFILKTKPSIKISILSYGSKAVINLTFQEFNHTSDIEKFIKSIKQVEGVSGLGSALFHTNNYIFESLTEFYDRRAIIIFTAHKHTVGLNPILISDYMGYAKSIKFVVVAIGNRTDKWIDDQKRGKYVVFVKDFEALTYKQNLITDSLCDI